MDKSVEFLCFHWLKIEQKFCYALSIFSNIAIWHPLSPVYCDHILFEYYLKYTLYIA
jgi:hypothetical protein